MTFPFVEYTHACWQLLQVGLVAGTEAYGVKSAVECLVCFYYCLWYQVGRINTPLKVIV